MQTIQCTFHCFPSNPYYNQHHSSGRTSPHHYLFQVVFTEYHLWYNMTECYIGDIQCCFRCYPYRGQGGQAFLSVLASLLSHAFLSIPTSFLSQAFLSFPLPTSLLLKSIIPLITWVSAAHIVTHHYGNNFSGTYTSH